MKKIILVLLLLFINSSIKATTYYSDYSNYDEYTPEYKESNDIRTCESERRYRWYQESMEGNYFLYNHNDSMYPNLDLSKNYVTEYTKWQDYEPENIEQRQIYMRYLYEVTKMKEVRYIIFNNVRGNYDYFRISELQIYINNQRINYTYQCNGCNSDFSSHINNNDYTENMSYINNGGSLIIDLQGYYDAKDIILKLALYDLGPTNMRYTIQYKREANSPIYLEKEFNELVDCDSLEAIQLKEKNINNLNPITPEWYDPIYYLYPQEETPTSIINIIKQYKYRDTYFYYYKINQDYIDGYYVTYNNYLKDTALYQDYYHCQYRDKITLEDDIVITNYNQTLDSFIYENTTKLYDIEGNINLYQNGTYPIVYHFPFIDVERSVIVDNPANDINLLLEKITSLKTELANIQQELNNQILTNENNINIINNLTNEKVSLELEITNLNTELYTLTKQIEALENTNNNNTNQINELLDNKRLLESHIEELDKELSNLRLEINNLTNTNNSYLETINNLLLDKNNLEFKIAQLSIIINETVNNYEKIITTNESQIQELIDSKESIEDTMLTLNNELDKQIALNTDNLTIINNLNEEISTLEESINNQDILLKQIEDYRNNIKTLNNTIIKQNDNLKSIISLKKDEANTYENKIKELNLILSTRDNEILKLQDQINNNVNPSVKRSSFSLDIINVIIVVLVMIFVILLKITIKKNVELK